MALFNGRSLGGQERRPGLLGRMRENRQQRRAGGSSAAMQPSPSFDQVAAVAKPVTPAPVIKPDVYRSGQGPDPATTPKTVSHVNRFGQGPDPANTPKVVLQGGPASPPPAGVTLPKSATNPLRGMSGQSMQGDAAAMKNAGMAALNRGDTGSALDSFQNAYRYRDQLSTKDQDMVQDKAQLLYNKQRSQELRDRANFKEMLEDPSIDPVNPPMGLFNPARGRNSNGPYEGYSIEPAVFDGSGVRAINTGLSSPSIPRRSESERLGVNPSNSSLATPFNQTGESFIPVSPQNPDLNSIVNGELQEGYTRSNQLLNEVNPPTWSQLMERSQDAYRDSFNNLPQGVLGDIAPFLSGQPAYPSLRSPGSQSVVDTVENSLFSAPGLVINPSVQPQPVAPAQPQASAPSQPQASAPAQPRPSAPSQPQQIAPDQPGYQAQFPAPADFALDRTFDQQRRKSIQDQMIKERMAALGGDPARSSLGVTQPAPPPNPDAFGYRTYTSDDGRFSRDAVVMGINNGKAVMQYGNGSVSEVPLDRLSPESREQAITSSALRDTARGYDANFNPVSPEQGFNRLFGGRDRNELFRSVTGEATAADPYTYRTEQVARDSQIFAPPENEPIDEEFVRQSSARDRNRTARALQPSGLPDIPDPKPFEPLLAPRGSAYYNPDDPRNRRPFIPIADRDFGQQYQDPTSGLLMTNNSTVRTVTNPDGSLSNMSFGPTARMDSSGNMIRVDADGKPVTDSSGRQQAFDVTNNLNLYGRPSFRSLDALGNPVEGSRTPPMTLEERKRMNTGTDYDKLNERRVQNNKDRSAARELSQEISEISALTGMSRSAAAGVVRQQREAQERLDESMKRQQEIEDRKLKIQEDEAASRRAQSELQAKQQGMDMEARQGELELMKREQRIAKSPAGPQLMFSDYDPAQRFIGIQSIMNGVDSVTGQPLSGSDQRWYLQNQFGITTKRQLIDAADAAGYSPPGRTTLSDIFTFDWLQDFETDQVWTEDVGDNLENLPGGTKGTLPKPTPVGQSHFKGRPHSTGPKI